MTQPFHRPGEEPPATRGHNGGPGLDENQHPAQQFLDTRLTEFPFEVEGVAFTSSKSFLASAGDLDKMTAAQIAHLYSHLKAQFDLVQQLEKDLSAFVELVKTVKLPSAFDREKIKTFTLQDGTRVTVSERVNASIPAEKKPEAYAWLRENGAGSLITETVNASTLSSFAKDVLSGGMAEQEIFDLPEEIFSVHQSQTTSVTRGKKKAK